MIKKITGIILLLISITTAASSQESTFWQRFYFGGGIGLGFSSGNTDFMIQPTIGFRLTRNLSTGILLDYEYLKNKDFHYTQHTYGGGIFLRYELPIAASFGLVAHGEYDYLSKRSKYDNGTKRNTDSGYIPLGAGLYFQSGRTRFSIIALWDMLRLNEEDGGSPSLRLGVTF
jgi:outer membrane protein assembly factor BamA